MSIHTASTLGMQSAQAVHNRKLRELQGSRALRDHAPPLTTTQADPPVFTLRRRSALNRIKPFSQRIAGNQL